MERYANQGRDSGVVAYAIEPGAIEVQFNDGSVYRYTDQSAGAANILNMQQLAREGAGLNEFINRRVKKRYASRSR